MDMAPQQLPLRDIHLPDTLSWWPPAPGWVGLAVLALTGVLLALWLRWRHQRRVCSVRYQGGMLLAGIRSRYASHGDRQRLLRELSAFMRRIAITVCARVEVSALTGTDWLRFLDQADAGRQRFSSGEGRILATGPYQAASEFDVNGLFLLVEDWLYGITEKNGHGTRV